MRRLLVLAHRWVGLATAGFLIVTGLTGAVIAWEHELDAILNPHFFQAEGVGTPLPSLELAARHEARDPRALVTYLPLTAEPGQALHFGVRARPGAAGGAQGLGYNELFLDPVTGEELGRRLWGEPWPLDGERLLPFLYKLHYSLYLPAFWGEDRWGIWLLGVVALLWTLDCFVGFALTLPATSGATGGPAGRETAGRGLLARWRSAWTIKRGAGAWRSSFDLHRAFGLWTWGLLFVLAFTSFSLALYGEVFRPMVAALADLSPSVYSERDLSDRPPAPPVTVTREEVLARATSEAERRGWVAPAGDLTYMARYDFYRVRFFAGGDHHAGGGLGPSSLFFDAADGRYLGDRQPGSGTLADSFLEAQFPLHSGHIAGVYGRAVVSAMGLLVTLLTVTGLVIWWRKRSARGRRRRIEAAS